CNYNTKCFLRLNNLSVYFLHRRHHCLHGTPRIYENSGVFCPTTEYLGKYPMYDNVFPLQSLKPKQEIRACCGKMEGITAFK
ncbi:stabilizer of axonemal microtubules 1-like, partial [Saimiri boliviensis]|uniref:stabilizer of axonemal microtubules 1-like n=1 Tax=Saimiri boliviensis TaxID=27679 RepID=UPI003D77453D